MSSREQLFEYLRERIEWAFTCDSKAGCFDEGSISGSTFGSKCLLAPWAFEQKPIVVAVNKLAPHERTLIRFVTGLNVCEADVSYLLVPIWAAFYSQYLAFHRLNSTSFTKAQRLIEYALVNYKLATAKQPILSNKFIMNAIDINDAKTFRRDWEPRLVIMKTVIASIERNALSLVLADIDSKRRKKHA